MSSRVTSWRFDHIQILVSVQLEPIPKAEFDLNPYPIQPAVHGQTRSEAVWGGLGLKYQPTWLQLNRLVWIFQANDPMVFCNNLFTIT